MRINIKNMAIDGLLGLAVGDALGVPYEFVSRRDVRGLRIHDMIGCDTGVDFESRWGYIIPAGAWSDDTSMTLAEMAAIRDDHGEIDHENIFTNFYRWWYLGEFTATGKSFGMGGTVGRAMNNFTLTQIPAVQCGQCNFEDNGNGSLMRILPFSLYCIAKGLSLDETVKVINDGSRMTHGHEISMMGCMIFTAFLKYIDKWHVAEAWDKARKINYGKYYGKQATDTYSLLLSDFFLEASDSCIGETGYVVDTLMTAVYSMLHSRGFESAILTAIGMGFDTDTAGAVTGALAGVCYGRGNIPLRWRKKLLKRHLLASTAKNFAKALIDGK